MTNRETLAELAQKFLDADDEAAGTAVLKKMRTAAEASDSHPDLGPAVAAAALAIQKADEHGHAFCDLWTPMAMLANPDAEAELTASALTEIVTEAVLEIWG